MGSLSLRDSCTYITGIPKAVIACESSWSKLSQQLSKEDYELVQELRRRQQSPNVKKVKVTSSMAFAGLMFSRKPMNLQQEEEKIDEESRLSRKRNCSRAVSAVASRFIIHTLVIKFTTIKMIALIYGGMLNE